MIDITVEMLKRKIASHEERVTSLTRQIREKELERATFLTEITSFKHTLTVLEGYAKQRE